MKRWLTAVFLVCLLVLCGCSRPELEETTEPMIEEMTEEAEEIEETSGIKVIENAGLEEDKTISLRIVDRDNPALPGRLPEKVRGIYISGPMASVTAGRSSP